MTCELQAINIRSTAIRFVASAVSHTRREKIYRTRMVGREWKAKKGVIPFHGHAGHPVALPTHLLDALTYRVRVGQVKPRADGRHPRADGAQWNGRHVRKKAPEPKEDGRGPIREVMKAHCQWKTA